MEVIGLGEVGNNKGATQQGSRAGKPEKKGIVTDLIICAQGVEALVGSSLTSHSFWW